MQRLVGLVGDDWGCPKETRSVLDKFCGFDTDSLTQNSESNFIVVFFVIAFIGIFCRGRLLCERLVGQEADEVISVALIICHNLVLVVYLL